jgi:MoxR-like ATPase
MKFRIDETGKEIAATERPIVIITSNNEKELPDAFLRRCVFHYIEFPGRELMQKIVRVHHPDLEDKVLDQALEVFYGLRATPKMRKRPTTSELIDWICALRKAGVDLARVGGGIPFLGALVKTEQDVELVGKRAKA